MKAKKLLNVTLLASVIFLIIFFLVTVVLKEYKIVNDPIWPDKIITGVIAILIYFFVMYYWMKRKIRRNQAK